MLDTLATLQSIVGMKSLLKHEVVEISSGERKVTTQSWTSPSSESSSTMGDDRMATLDYFPNLPIDEELARAQDILLRQQHASISAQKDVLKAIAALLSTAIDSIPVPTTTYKKPMSLHEDFPAENGGPQQSPSASTKLEITNSDIFHDSTTSDKEESKHSKGQALAIPEVSGPVADTSAETSNEPPTMMHEGTDRTAFVDVLAPQIIAESVLLTASDGPKDVPFPEDVKVETLDKEIAISESHPKMEPIESPQAEVVEEERIEIKIPDMFVSFMAQKPKINRHYEQVRAESEAWLIKCCDMDARTRKRVAQCNFSYFSAICAPDADCEGLRILCDWGNWVFPFDDMFDNGHLRQDPEKAHKMIDDCLSVMDDGQEGRAPETPLIEVHDTIWHRVLKNSPKGLQRRYVESMRDYCHGAVEHVEDAFEGKIPELEDYIAIHRKAAGVRPIFCLVEYANKIDIPDWCFDHPSLKEIDRIGTDVVFIQNDIVSYLKEESEGVNHNIVAVCRSTGLSAQAAFDRVGELLQDRYRDWYLAQASLPQWGEEIDTQVQKYIRGVHETMLANLNFSFYSERYFGEKRHATRIDRKVLVKKHAPMATAAEIAKAT